MTEFVIVLWLRPYRLAFFFYSVLRPKPLEHLIVSNLSHLAVIHFPCNNIAVINLPSTKIINQTKLHFNHLRPLRPAATASTSRNSLPLSNAHRIQPNTVYSFVCSHSHSSGFSALIIRTSFILQSNYQSSKIFTLYLPTGHAMSYLKYSN